MQNTNDSHLTWEEPALEGKMEVTDAMVRQYLRGAEQATERDVDAVMAGGYAQKIRRGLKAVLDELPQFSQSYTEETKRTADAIIEHFNAHKPLATNRELELLRLIADQANGMRNAGRVLAIAMPALQEIAKRNEHPSDQLADRALKDIGPLAAF